MRAYCNDCKKRTTPIADVRNIRYGKMITDKRESQYSNVKAEIPIVCKKCGKRDLKISILHVKGTVKF